MKKAFSCTLFVLILFSVTNASAYVVSHRYVIPNTDYTIEVPWFISVISKNMTEYEPFIFELDGSYEDAQAVMSNYTFDMVGTAATNSGMDYNFNFFVEVMKFDEPLSNPINEMTDQQLESFANTMVDAYYDSHPTEKPYNEKQLYSIYNLEHTKSILFKTVHGENSVTENYIILEKEYGFSISVDYEENNTYMEDKKVVTDILNSLKKDFMIYENL